MVLQKRVIFDAITKTETIVTEDLPAPALPGPFAKGLDFNKLKAVLKAKAIIANNGEVE